jgi:hypothetical protein
MDVNAPCIQNPGPTDKGRVAISVAWQVAAAALGAANAVTSAEMASKQFDLAQRYYQIARQWRDWYNQGYVPLEDMELDEIWAEGKAEPLYGAAAGRASVLAKLAFGDRIGDALRCTHEYATGLRQALLKDGIRSMAEGVAASEGMGIRNERARVEALNDLRWKHREAAAMRGRGMAASNVAFAQLAAGIYGDLGRQAGQAAAGYVRSIFFARERMGSLFPSGERGKGIRNEGKPRQTASAQAGFSPAPDLPVHAYAPAAAPAYAPAPAAPAPAPPAAPSGPTGYLRLTDMAAQITSELGRGAGAGLRGYWEAGEAMQSRQSYPFLF